MAAAVAIVTVGAQSESESAKQASSLLPYLGLFFVVVGILFVSMFLSQRYNLWAFYSRMALLEDTVLLLGLTKHTQTQIRAPLEPNPNLGADGSVLLLYSVVNSSVLAVSAYSVLPESLSAKRYGFAAAAVLLALAGHWLYVRRVNKVLDHAGRRYC